MSNEISLMVSGLVASALRLASSVSSGIPERSNARLNKICSASRDSSTASLDFSSYGFISSMSESTQSEVSA